MKRHKPFRYYYIFRNTLLVVRRPYVSVKMALFQLRWLPAGLFIAFGIFGRSGELAMMFRGARDAFRGITGKIRNT